MFSALYEIKSFMKKAITVKSHLPHFTENIELLSRKLFHYIFFIASVYSMVEIEKIY